MQWGGKFALDSRRSKGRERLPSGGEKVALLEHQRRAIIERKTKKNVKKFKIGKKKDQIIWTESRTSNMKLQEYIQISICIYVSWLESIWMIHGWWHAYPSSLQLSFPLPHPRKKEERADCSFLSYISPCIPSNTQHAHASPTRLHGGEKKNGKKREKSRSLFKPCGRGGCWSTQQKHGSEKNYFGWLDMYIFLF